MEWLPLLPLRLWTDRCGLSKPSTFTTNRGSESWAMQKHVFPSVLCCSVLTLKVPARAIRWLDMATIKALCQFPARKFSAESQRTIRTAIPMRQGERPVHWVCGHRDMEVMVSAIEIYNEAVQDTLGSNTRQRVHYFYKGVANRFLKSVAIAHFYSETHKPRPSGVAARSSGPLVLWSLGASGRRVVLKFPGYV